MNDELNELRDRFDRELQQLIEHSPSSVSAGRQAELARHAAEMLVASAVWHAAQRQQLRCGDQPTGD